MNSNWNKFARGGGVEEQAKPKKKKLKIVIKEKPVEEPAKPKKKKLVIKEKPVEAPVEETSKIKILLEKYPNEATIIGDIWKKTIDRRNPSGFKKMTSVELYEKHLEILKTESFLLSLRSTFGKKEKMDTNKPELFIKRYEDRVFNFLSTKEALDKPRSK